MAHVPFLPGCATASEAMALRDLGAGTDEEPRPGGDRFIDLVGRKDRARHDRSRLAVTGIAGHGLLRIGVIANVA